MTAGDSCTFSISGPKPSPIEGEVRNAVERYDCLHVRAFTSEIALVPALFAVRGAQHLHEVAARRVAEDPDPGGIDPVLGRVGPEVADRGLAVFNKRGEVVRNHAVLAGRDHEPGAS